ncbi:hypothetical protein H072_450 [Dactylellina haptotyla CBS 200.50]|uniref:Carboxypeptidase n=1 Tax=Dactylellina haptotyla (strain CBS 200.50) TaxID=1284197 RepID=S8CCZ4_DACHA|nr:hypothetical protein H072_450 [Dactylellina haptotyla CBS 200.50]
MKFGAVSALAGLLFSTATFAAPTWDRSPQNIERLRKEMKAEAANRHQETVVAHLVNPVAAAPVTHTQKHTKFYNSKTKEFWVNGTAGAIPDVNFDVPESFAGLMPISADKNETRKLYFWFFPTLGGKDTEDDLVIWLNGGPGCSSLEGLMQENGPFTWKAGTYLPVKNKYTWANLSNIVWVEQPVGTGFSQGEPNILNEQDMAAQFLGFFKNFVDKFGLHRKRIWITGESYAGVYIPYIADAMYNKKDTRNFNLKGTLIYDPSIASDLISEEVPAVPFMLRNQAIFNLPDEIAANLTTWHEKCGYADIYKQGLTFPPAGKINVTGAVKSRDCRLWSKVWSAANRINPCFNVYHITDTCPSPWDVMGMSDDFGDQPKGAKTYFTRPEVQKAINAPIMPDWSECSEKDVFPHGDKSVYPAPGGILSRVIEKSERTIVAHGLHDYILLAEGTLMALNNMTWHGAQGFSERPSSKFVVPYDGQGDMGVWREERGLTYIEIKASGHMVPGYQPGAAFRHLEYLLGKVKDMSVI